MLAFAAEKGLLQGHDLKSPMLPKVFLQGIFKSRVWEGDHKVGGQLVHSSVISWWWWNRVVWERLTLSVLRLQEAWGYIYAHCHPLLIVQFSSVAQSCPTLCNPVDCSMPGLPVHHQFLEFTQTHVHWVSDVIQPSHPLLSPSPPAFNLCQHQDLFKWVSSFHQMAKVLEFQLRHQSFQCTFRTDFPWAPKSLQMVTPAMQLKDACSLEEKWWPT